MQHGRIHAAKKISLLDQRPHPIGQVLDLPSAAVHEHDLASGGARTGHGHAERRACASLLEHGAADLDQDGDQDVVAASTTSGEISCWKNADGSGTNWVKQIISLVDENQFGQIFITDTNEQRLLGILEEIPADHKVYRINREAAVEEMEA